MKFSRNTVVSFVVLILIAALYRAMPGRPLGFAPQIAMALFAGSVFKDRKYAFALPIFSMFISDMIYQFLYIYGGGVYPGFYGGQLTNYVLFGLLTIVGFFIKERKVLSILAGSLVAPTIYFLTSNFLVWISGGGYARPKTWEGLILCFNDALPFYRTSIVATLFFSFILFGSHLLLTKPSTIKQTA